MKQILRGTGPLPQQGTVAAWGAPSIIRSVQSGYTSSNTPTTATILPVVPDNCLFLHNGFNAAGYTAAQYFQGWVQLTNATTVSLLAVGVAGATAGVQWSVIEFVPGIVKSVQAGVIDLAGNASATATINPVNPNRCLLTLMGVISSRLDSAASIWPTRLTLTDSTTITASRFSVGEATSSPWRLVELF